MADNAILLLTSNHVDWLSEKLDDLTKFKNVILETVDRPAYKIGLNQLNRLVSPYIPDEYKDELHVALDDVIDGDKDYTEAIENAILVAQQLLDKITVLKPVWKELAESVLKIAEALLLNALNKAE